MRVITKIEHFFSDVISFIHCMVLKHCLVLKNTTWHCQVIVRRVLTHTLHSFICLLIIRCTWKQWIRRLVVRSWTHIVKLVEERVIACLCIVWMWSSMCVAGSMLKIVIEAMIRSGHTVIGNCG